jgi:uncharacterized membrane protein (DUF485 family)
MPELIKIKEDPSFQLLCKRRWRSCIVLILLALSPFFLMIFLASYFDSLAFDFLLAQDNRHVWYFGGLMMFYFLALSALHVFVANNYHEDANTQVELVLKARDSHY